MSDSTEGRGAQAAERLAYPLDVDSLSEAEQHIDRLAAHVGVFKVGLELFTAVGPAAVHVVHARGRRCFLDLKLHDIPATVAGAVRAARELGVAYLTLHASTGTAAMRAAADAAAGSELRLLAVTVLTSLDDAALDEIGMAPPAERAVARLGQLAANSGIRGLVCSPMECAMLRAQLGPDVYLVTPGVRPAGVEVGDQRRVATPTSAIAAGADLLVVGRPIREAADPATVAAGIVAEIARAAR